MHLRFIGRVHRLGGDSEPQTVVADAVFRRVVRIHISEFNVPALTFSHTSRQTLARPVGERASTHLRYLVLPRLGQMRLLPRNASGQRQLRTVPDAGQHREVVEREGGQRPGFFTHFRVTDAGIERDHESVRVHCKQ